WKSKKNVLSKPNTGHGGYGISMLEDVIGDDWSERLQQESINTEGDVRFYIINNKIIHAVLRRPKDKLVSNYSQGGVCEIFKYSDEQEKTVYNFIRDLSIDYAGVDFLLTTDGELVFNEIEDVVGSRMLSYLGINNTTDLYLDHIMVITRKVTK
ncbi:MAG: ATP-dependent carboxylate-amine ligase, partial [Ruminiclostridium sp.]|nr:ATP-dependent carboxylate-amine ligase [Ruminiclostridium sp.]